jgi:Effector-associated domain 11
MTQTIQQLLSEGKLSEAIADTRAWAKKNADASTQTSLVLLAQRHATNEKAHLMDSIPLADYSMERNRISAALLSVVDSATAATATRSKTTPTFGALTIQKWAAVATFLAAVMTVIANFGTIKESFLKKEEPKAIVQPIVPPKAVEKPIVVPEKPQKAVETSTPSSVEPQKAAAEPTTAPKNLREKVKKRIETAKNRFESRDQSKQINVPDNKGTININQ